MQIHPYYIGNFLKKGSKLIQKKINKRNIKTEIVHTIWLNAEECKHMIYYEIEHWHDSRRKVD